MKILLALVATVAFVACNDSRMAPQEGKQSVQFEASPSAPPMADRAAVGSVASSGDPRPGRVSTSDVASSEEQSAVSPEGIAPMIIKTGDATVEVDSLEIAVAQVTALAKQLGGAVASSSMETGRKDLRTAQLTLRIPSARFDAALSGLSPIGKVESQNVGSQDVTEEFVDMTARMTNARRLEDRLIDLLAKRTGKLEEVLAVERELARVREEIERYEGRLRYLKTRAAISTLTVNLHEPYPISGTPRGSNVLVEAFKNAWRNFVGFVASLISASGVLIPLILLVGIGIYLLRKFGFWPTMPWNRPDPPRGPPAPPAA